MKRCLVSFSALALVLCAGPAFAQLKAKAENVPEIPYTSVPNFLKLPAGRISRRSRSRVATNSKGHIFVYHRSANTRLFEFDQNGNFLKEIGKGYYGFEFAHSVRVDTEDNIWTVDEGTNMVTKFSPGGQGADGARPPAAGRCWARSRFPAGPNQPSQKYIFCRPTDVGWDPQGNIFVSDGYCNNRVVKYDKNGRFLAQVGSEKAGKGPGEFNLPHGLAVDGRATSTSPTAATSATRSSTTTSSRRRPTTMSGSAGRCAFRKARTSTCSLPTRTRTATRREPGTSPARSTRWSWTARSSASSAMPARSSAASRSSHMMDCRNPERDHRRRDRILARAEVDA